MTTKIDEKSKQHDCSNIFKIKSSEQYATIEDLFSKSQPSSVYHTFLILSSLIIACGLLLPNSTIVIGGMLVTPLLTPILVVALGISVGEMKAIKTASILVLRSALTVVAISFVLSLIFGRGQVSAVAVFDDSLRMAVLYFIVALISGVAATFAWIRKEVMDILPGIAIAVSLVPPLSMFGVYLSRANFTDARLIFFVFMFNLVGVVLGSTLVFSLLKFHKAEKMIKEEAVNQEKEIQEQKEQKAKEKAKEAKEKN